jgi:glycosyltransferase involved in cell wall biosynthesis
MTMGEPVRVLHVLGGLSLGGAESRIMDLYRCIDREKVQFDFLVHQSAAGERIPEFYDEEVKELGGRIYLLPKFKGYNYFSYRKAVREFFAAHDYYRVVQGHMTSTAAIYLPEAAKAGIPVRAAHARSAGVDRGIKGVVTRLLRIPLLGQADYCFACSGEAGEAVFGKKWKSSPKALVIPNAVDAGKFVYKKEVRDRIRKEWGLEDRFVIGHVGRFHYAKNHEFLLEVFAAVQNGLKEKGMEAALMLLGEGSGMDAAKKQAAQLGIGKSVLFMGNRKEVWDYYQAMDYFVFPSRFEGLPGTVVEAQAAGLKCLISDRITREVGFTELVAYKNIDLPAKDWAEQILDGGSYERENMCRIVAEAGFDVKEQAKRMEHFYVSGKMG